MYSHDTFGLGHIRRTLLIAEHLSEAIPDLSILILTGSSMIHSMRIPPNIDYIKVPCLVKKSNEHYAPKYLSRWPKKVRMLRKQIINTTIREFNPNYLLVDKAPIGVQGELQESLFYLKKEKTKTRIILGIRDVLDGPGQTKRDWEQNGIYDVLDDLYDDIWVYGTPTIFDVVKEYELPPSIAEKVHFCGYLRRKGPFTDPPAIKERLGISGKKMILMTMGGGGDGDTFVKTFFSAMRELSHDDELRFLVITGPDFPVTTLQALIKESTLEKITVVKDYTVDILDYMNAADLIISMAGYNTSCEILSLNKKAIVIPRIHPRKEQLIRASKLCELGLLNTIHPIHLTAEILKTEIRRALDAPPRPHHPFEVVDFNGLENILHRFRSFQLSSSLHLSLPLMTNQPAFRAVNGLKMEDHDL